MSTRANAYLNFFIHRAISKGNTANATLLRRQWDELHPEEKEGMPVVTCPCGRKRALSLAFRCLYCGIYFCADCAETHFGETQQEYYNRIDSQPPENS